MGAKREHRGAAGTGQGGPAAARARGRAARAVTLVEMVVALALTTIVVAAATAVMFVASRALPTSGDAAGRATEAAVVLAMLEAEAHCAEAVRLTGDQIWFQIPDRTGDSVPEEVRYVWGGNTGDPLTRQDALAKSEVIPQVAKLQIEWSPARGSGTRVGTLFLTITLDRGLVVRSTVRLPAEPENRL